MYNFSAISQSPTVFLMKLANFNADTSSPWFNISLFICSLAKCLFSTLQKYFDTFSPSDIHLALECSNTPSILLLLISVRLNFKSSNFYFRLPRITYMNTSSCIVTFTTERACLRLDILGFATTSFLIDDLELVSRTGFTARWRCGDSWCASIYCT